jgi:HK97 gp10 family phage protein
MMELKVYGHEQLMADLTRISSSLDAEVVDGLEEVADKIKEDAKNLCPVDTGSLRKSVRRQKHSSPSRHVHSIGVSAGGYVKNPKTGRPVDYAAHVEFGTSRTPPQPFMGPAVEKNKGEVRRILTKEILEALR